LNSPNTVIEAGCPNGLESMLDIHLPHGHIARRSKEGLGIDSRIRTLSFQPFTMPPRTVAMIQFIEHHA
jgi:hypothetical protein